MKVGGPDWGQIRADTRRGVSRFWPMLALLLVVVEPAVSVAGSLLLGTANTDETGLAGYVGYLKLVAWDMLPLTAVYLVAAALILNGLSEQPIGRGAMVRRALAYFPTAVLVFIAGAMPYLLSTLITYSNVDYAGWWYAHASGSLAAVALSTIIGFTTLEAIAKGLPPAEAFRASAALTFGHRAWLFWLFAVLEAVFVAVQWAGSAVHESLRAAGLWTLPGQPVTEVVGGLISMVTMPLNVAVYLELRRMEAEDVPGLGAVFD